MAGNGKSKTAGDSAAKTADTAQPSPEMMEKIAKLRSHVRESFGKIAMAMMMLPRYRNQSIADLQHLVLEPLIRDRIAMAYPGTKEGDEEKPTGDMVGFAIWASVSNEVDAKIREQIKAGTFPVRLSGEEWVSGENNWLLDVVASSSEAAVKVLTNFRQVISTPPNVGTDRATRSGLKLHPAVARAVGERALQRMGVSQIKDDAEEAR